MNRRKPITGIFVGKRDTQMLQLLSKEREGAPGWTVVERADEAVHVVDAMRGKRLFAEGGLVPKCLADVVARAVHNKSLVVVDMNRTGTAIHSSAHERTYQLKDALQERGVTGRALRRVRVYPSDLQRILSGKK